MAWPKDATNANIQLLEDGRLRLVSVDEYAVLTLEAHGLDFSVEYLAKVVSDCPAHIRAKTSSICQRPEAQMLSMHRYHWIVQHNAVHRCPECFTHPLSIAQQCLGRVKNRVRFRDESAQGDATSYCLPDAVNIGAPNSIPATCLADSVDHERLNSTQNTTSCTCLPSTIDDEELSPKKHLRSVDRYIAKMLELQQSNDHVKDVVLCDLPTSLPVSCPNPHLHRL